MNKSLFKISCFAFLLISPLFFGLFSCKKEGSLLENEKMRLESNRTTTTNIVSAEDYNSLEPQEKKIVDMLNSAVSGIKGAAALNGKNISDFTGYVSIGKDPQYDNVIIVFNDSKPGGRMAAGGGCTICNTWTQLRPCLSKIQKPLDELKDDESLSISVTVNKDDCYVVAW
jgi:hypothetical protein